MRMELLSGLLLSEGPYKKSEERLRESEEKYRTVVENMKIGMYRSTGDPKGGFVWGILRSWKF